jgi:hypothetical protein
MPSPSETSHFENVPWGARPSGYAIGVRPHRGHVELMIGIPGEPTYVVTLSRSEARDVRQAILQSLRDLGAPR